MQPGEEGNAENGNPERAGIARQAEFIRGARARGDPYFTRASGQAEHVASVRSYQRVYSRSVDQQMQVRVVGQRKARARTGTVQQPLPNCSDDRATGQHWCTWFLWWHMPAGIRVLEQPAITIVAVAFRRH